MVDLKRGVVVAESVQLTRVSDSPVEYVITRTRSRAVSAEIYSLRSASTIPLNCKPA